MMKTTLLTAFSILLAFNSLAYQVDQTLQVDPNGRVDIENLPGKLRIEGWDRPEVSVKGTLDDKIKDFIFESNGKTTRIEVKDDRNGLHSDDRLDGDLTVMLPRGSDVEVECTNTDIQLSGLNNQLEVELINGDISASELKGLTELSTVNGDIKVKKLAGEVELATINGEIEAIESEVDKARYSTINGEIDLQATASRLSVDSINGDVLLKALSVQDLELNTVNGEIEANVIFVGDNPKVVASSVSGDIALILDPEVSARFTVEAHVGGDIDNRLSDDRPDKDRFGLREELEFQLGDGDARIDMTTVSGDLILKAR